MDFNGNRRGSLIDTILGILLALTIIALIVLVAIGLQKKSLGGAISITGSLNPFSTVTHTVTSTLGLEAVQLLATTTARTGVLIQNDGATAVYLRLKSFPNATNATANVTPNSGIRVNANGGEYKILPENLYTGPIWATSTAQGMKILITESQ